MCISNKVGPPVEGDDFFGRARELKQANRLLDTNHSLLLSAPRRIGKSSFAKRLIEEKRRAGWKCVYIDLEEKTTEEGFIRLIIDSFTQGNIWKQITEDMTKSVATLLKKIEKVSIGPVDINLGRGEKEEDLYQSLKEAIGHDEDTLIVVDELTLFLGILNNNENGPEKVAFILNWLRSLRQVSQTKVRWLFCGSVGLRNFTSNLELGYTINDLTEFSLDELSHEEAVGLFSGLGQAEDIRLSSDVVEYTLNKLHWNIPYFIQVIFSKVAETYDGEQVAEQDIDAAYQKLCSENYLNTWSERLKEYRELELPARKVLKALAIKPEGLDREGLLNILMTAHDASKVDDVDYMLSKLMRMLENDGYLLKRDSIRAFRSPLLRDYWYQTFVE
jgi:AAA+ ATPase superfamily predicted ATPase